MLFSKAIFTIFFQGITGTAMLDSWYNCGLCCKSAVIFMLGN